MFINFLPSGSEYIGNVSLNLSPTELIIDLQSGNFNGDYIETRAVEIIATKNPSNAVLNIAGRIITVPAYGYAVFNVPQAANFMSVYGYGPVTLNFYNKPKNEFLTSFPAPILNINTADYAEFLIYINKVPSTAAKYGTLCNIPGAAGTFIDTPIRIAAADFARVTTILGNNFIESTYGLYCYYGFSADNVIIPLQGGQILLNSPLSTAEYWIRIDTTNATATFKTVLNNANYLHGSVLKEFYGSV